MKKLTLALLALLFICSCDDPNVRNGRKIYKEYFKEVLIDPESLKIYKEEIIKHEGSLVVFKVDYGAKNGFGAYARRTSEFEILGPYIMSIDGKPYISDKELKKILENSSK
jgi:hypothetical protein